MPIFRDRVRDTSTTTGTGDLTVSGSAPTGYISLSTAGYVANDSVSYAITHQSANEWEVGVATLTSTTVLARSTGTVLASSNGNALVNFSAGTKDFFITTSANDIEQRDSRGSSYAHRLHGAF